MFLAEVSFPLKADHFHPLEGVVHVVVTVTAKVKQESVSTELDVFAHHDQIKTQ
jgi:hypothetical protein